jgi:archaellum biogenesis ATPase FlaH
MDWHVWKQKSNLNVLFLHKYRIYTTVMQLDSLELVYDNTDTNYATRCRYLCNEVRYIKICFMLHAHKFRVTRMCIERKWIDMHGNKKI